MEERKPLTSLRQITTQPCGYSMIKMYFLLFANQTCNVEQHVASVGSLPAGAAIKLPGYSGVQK